MNRTITTSIAFVILFLFVEIKNGISQEDDFGVVFWSVDRDLVWDDIQGEPLIDTMNGFYLDLYMYPPFNANGYYYGDVRLDKLAYVFKKSSYVSEDIRNDDLLRYLNVYFDMAAYYSYKYIIQTAEAQKSTNSTIRENPHIMGNAVVEEWKLESNRFTIETKYGEEIEVLLGWESRINELVKTIKKPEPQPFEPVFSFDIALGKLVGSAGYKDLLTEPVVGYLGLEYISKPYVVVFGLSGGGQDVLKTFSKGDKTFPIGSNPNLMNLFFHGGYMILDSKRFRIIPRIGMHFSNLRYPRNNDFDASEWAISYTAGATMDVKLVDWYTRYGLSTLGSGLSLRFGAFYYPTKIGEHNLNHTLLTVGISWTFSRSAMMY
jgi:hypothetical protein